MIDKALVARILASYKSLSPREQAELEKKLGVRARNSDGSPVLKSTGEDKERIMRAFGFSDSTDEIVTHRGRTATFHAVDAETARRAIARKGNGR